MVNAASGGRSHLTDFRSRHSLRPPTFHPTFHPSSPSYDDPVRRSFHRDYQLGSLPVRLLPDRLPACVPSPVSPPTDLGDPQSILDLSSALSNLAESVGDEKVGPPKLRKSDSSMVAMRILVEIRWWARDRERHRDNRDRLRLPRNTEP